MVLILSIFSTTPGFAQTAPSTEIIQLKVEQANDGLYLSANLRFELPHAVEEALLKGIALTFVAQAQVYRNRWYWYDKNIVTHTRQMRVAFQPLTRRWRLNLAEGTGTGLVQSFDSLPEVLSALRRISQWKIAESHEIDADSRHNIDFRFRLDTSQLPRPLQIGVTGNTEWAISTTRNIRPEAAPSPALAR